MSLATLRRFGRWILTGDANDPEPEQPDICDACVKGIHPHNVVSGECLYHKAGCRCRGVS